MWSEEFRLEDRLLYRGQDVKGFTGLSPPAVGGKRQLRVVGRERRGKQVGMEESLEEEQQSSVQWCPGVPKPCPNT